MRLRRRDAATEPIANSPEEVGAPMKVRAQPGYYPGYDTLSQKAFWDKTTRDTVLKRLTPNRELKFFAREQAEVLEAVFDRLMPQEDRDPEHRIDLISVVDDRLAAGRIDGYRYEGMPPDREAYELGLQAIDEMAQSVYSKPFTACSVRQQEELLKGLHDAKPAPHRVWENMPVHRFWMLLMQDAVEAYYAHPYAWNEIGYGGPAYPRAYTRLERGEPEPWEVHEVRYEWSAPADSLSDVAEPVGGADTHHATPGQGGTH